jgi:hypothetical protein
MRALVATAVVSVLGLIPGAAFADPGVANGVHIDPGSPAAKQYVIPIVGARGETAGGGSGSNASSSQTPPPFGSGITPARRATRQAALSAKRRGAAAAKAASSRRAADGRPSAAPVALTPLGSDHGSGAGGTAWLALIGGGAVVLVIGAGGGLALRRRL